MNGAVLRGFVEVEESSDHIRMALCELAVFVQSEKGKVQRSETPFHLGLLRKPLRMPLDMTGLDDIV